MHQAGPPHFFHKPYFSFPLPHDVPGEMQDSMSNAPLKSKKSTEGVRSEAGVWGGDPRNGGRRNGRDGGGFWKAGIGKRGLGSASGNSHRRSRGQKVGRGEETRHPTAVAGAGSCRVGGFAYCLSVYHGISQPNKEFKWTTSCLMLTV